MEILKFNVYRLYHGIKGFITIPLCRNIIIYNEFKIRISILTTEFFKVLKCEYLATSQNSQRPKK